MWFDESNFGVLKKDMPMTQIYRGSHNGNMCELEFMFLSLDGESDVAKLLSLELSWLWFSELREISESVFDEAVKRVGRYPPIHMLPDGVELRKSVHAESNYPHERHWIVERFFTNPQLYPNYEVFEQPAPLIYNSTGVLVENPDAENIGNLPGGYQYYWDIVKGSSERTWKVQVLCQFGADFDGKPVYPEYKENLHRSQIELMPVPGVELGLGWDFGFTPACVITQNINGRLVVLDEIICADSIGISDFIEALVWPLLRSPKYQDHEIVSVCDPSGEAGKNIGIPYYIGELNKHGLNAKKAPTNNLDPRLETVTKKMSQLVSGEPALLLSKTAVILHQGFVSGYMYKVITGLNGWKMPADKPYKNEYSHIHDALQYIACYYYYREQKKRVREPQLVNIGGKLIQV